MRDATGNRLDVFDASGSTFQEIIHKLWERCGDRVKGRAVKEDGVWSMEPATEAKWAKVMQFKIKRHLVDSTETDHLWNQWLLSTRAGQALVYDYGLRVGKAQDLEEVALECVNCPLTNYEDLHNEWEIFGKHLHGHQRNLNSRKRIIEGLLRDLAPPTADEVIDPLHRMDNLGDTEHQE
ncbi:LOW QUALITY PROTEIN: Hypothetical protein PHPALM_16560 [Phytophthora palmivora]|uniref:Uncharacterized protein n=1 Tax=Phytophthora palmivora TaxID=4796 RepID=A0A2P4XPG1_9STRA|nr:LOW QUALITY PROTEIN: Hypothetical protein PHPALM_16560 [Phytophthora palmivora]